VHEKETLWANPAIGVAVKLYVAEPPALTVTEFDDPGDTASEKFSCPLPRRVTFCRPRGALSVMVSTPVLLPSSPGLKVTFPVHEDDTAIESPHVSVIA
jgi:hypothetical protein